MAAGTKEQQRTPAYVIAGLLAFAFVWLLHLGQTSFAAPVDNIEQLVWVRSLEWGYYKHPPLPTWLLWLPVKVFGLTPWTTYVLGAALTLTALGLFWGFLAQLRGPAYASVALAAALCITFYNGRLTYYNHNVVLLLVEVASAWLCWLALARRQLRWWAGLGVALGLGALAKYQVALTVLSILVCVLLAGSWRDALHRRGLVLAAAIALLLFSPHLWWLPAHGWGPIGYAMESSLGVHLSALAAVGFSLNWLADELLNRAAPAWIVLLLFAWGARHDRRGDSPSAMDSSSPGRVPEDRLSTVLLVAFAVTPFAVMLLIGALFGADLQKHWGTPFLLFCVPAVMELSPRSFWQRVPLRLAAASFLATQALLLWVSIMTSPYGLPQWSHHYRRAFDAAALASTVGDPARRELAGSVRVVIGPQALAGTLAVELPEHPLVLIDGSGTRSPWVPRDLVARCGAIVLDAPKNASEAGPDRMDPGSVRWHVLRPGPGETCPLDTRNIAKGTQALAGLFGSKQ